jgi:hypothetical protein
VPTRPERRRPTGVRWALLASMVLVGVGLWYVSRPAPSQSQLEPGPEATTPPGAPESVAKHTVPALDHAEGDPCAGLELLDVEAGGDGSAQGVWLRNPRTGPSLVRPGGQFSKLTLTRIKAVGPGYRSAKVWFGTSPRPCELDAVPGIELAQALPPPPTAPVPTTPPPATAKPVSDGPPPHPALPGQAPRISEKEPLLDEVRNPALIASRFGSRSLGGGRSFSRAVSASVDAEAP